MTTILCLGQPDGSLQMSDYQRATMRQYIKDNVGRIRLKLEKMTPESREQRGYFEGCLVGLVTFYQEGLDHRNHEDCRKVREWLKQEFNGEMVMLEGKAHVVGKSTKNELNNGFIEKILDWINENYAPPFEALNPESYKDWHDRIYPYGGADNYIDYLRTIHKI